MGLCGGEDGEPLADGVEVGNGERRRRRLLPGPPARWRDGAGASRLGLEEGLGGRGAPEPLMRSEEQIVNEGELDPLLQVLAGQWRGQGEGEALLEGSPEPLEPRGGVEVVLRDDVRLRRRWPPCRTDLLGWHSEDAVRL